MKIGILGSGAVGIALADGFVKYGIAVKVGTRTLSKLDDWNERSGDLGTIGSFEETAQFGDIVILAVRGLIAQEVLDMAGKENLAGKTIIDATNPIAPDGPDNGVLRFFTEANTSLMESLQSFVPEANFVKAFNSIGAGFMVDPSFEMKPSMFICGNNEEAKEAVSKILDQFGWDVEDMGGVESARPIEALSMLWCVPGFRDNRWNHAFRLMKV